MFYYILYKMLLYMQQTISNMDMKKHILLKKIFITLKTTVKIELFFMRS